MRSSPSTKGVTVPHKLLLREAAVQMNDGVSSLWSARYAAAINQSINACLSITDIVIVTMFLFYPSVLVTQYHVGITRDNGHHGYPLYTA